MRSLTLLIAAIFTSTSFAQVKIIEGQYPTGITAPTNYVKNVGCYVNTSGITVSGGTLLRNTTSPINVGIGADCKWTATALAQTLSVGTKTVLDPLLKGQNCQFDMTYMGNGTGYKAYLFRGTKLTTDAQLVDSGTGTKHISILAPCGDLTVPTVPMIEATIASPAALQFTSMSYGLATNIGTVAQANLVGSLVYPITTGCTWDRSSSVFGGFTAVAACPTPTTSGSLVYAGTKIPAFTINNVKPGNYYIVATGEFFVSTTQNFGFRFSDGTNFFGNNGGNNQSSAVNTASLGNIIGSITYTTSAPSKTIEIQGYAATANHDIRASNIPLEFDVYYFPTQDQTVIRLDQANYDWTTFTPASLNLGTPTFQACRHKREGPDLLVSCTVTSTSAPGAEMQLGLPPGLTISTNSAKIPTNPTGAGTALPIGRVDRGNGTGAYDNTVLAQPGKTYVNFGVANPSSNSLVIVATSAIVLAGETFTVTYRVPIEGWTENQNAPLLVGSVTGGSGLTNFFSANFAGATVSSICTTPTCILYGATSNITSVTYSSGVYTLTVPPGQCTSPLVCSWTPSGQQAAYQRSYNITPTTCTMSFADGVGSLQSQSGAVQCSCQK